MKKINIGLIVIIVAILAVWFFNRDNSVNKDEVRIGAIMTMTGRAAFLGEVDKNAMNIAVKEINERYPNKKVVLIVEDSQSDAKVGATVASKLINVDKVNAIFVETTGPSVAVSPIAKSAGIPLIYSSFTDVPLKDNSSAMKTFIDYGDVCSNYARYIKSTGENKVASLGDSNGLAELCANSMKDILGSENVAVVDFSPTIDVRTEILKLKSKGYKALISSSYEPNMIKVLKSMNEVNYKPTFMCNTGACATENVKKEIGVNNLGNIITFDAKVSDSFVNKYSSSYKPLTAGELQNASFDYNAVYDLYNGVVNCSKGDVECFVKNVKSSKPSESAIVGYTWKNNSVIPKIKFSKVVNGALEEIKLNK